MKHNTVRRAIGIVGLAAAITLPFIKSAEGQRNLPGCEGGTPIQAGYTSLFLGPDRRIIEDGVTTVPTVSKETRDDGLRQLANGVAWYETDTTITSPTNRTLLSDMQKGQWVSTEGVSGTIRIDKTYNTYVEGVMTTNVLSTSETRTPSVQNDLCQDQRDIVSPGEIGSLQWSIRPSKER